MKLLRALALSALCALSPIRQACAVDFDAAIGKTAIGRCHMDVCSFFSIQTSLPVAVRKDGTLFAISELSWTSTYKPTDDTNIDEYKQAPISTSSKTPDAFLVFCSKERPYEFWMENGTWETLALRPGDETALSGAAEAAYSQYWAACHHYLPKSVWDVGKMATKLGYHFSAGTEDTDSGLIKQPSDLLK